MKTDVHIINCFDGAHEARLDFFNMDRVEPIDVYDQPPDLFDADGFRIEGMIDGVPAAGTLFYSGLLGSHYYGQEDSTEVARDFGAEARRSGALPAVRV